MACHQAARAAVQYGYTNVHIMSVGIDGWKKAGKPVESGGPSA